VLEFVAPVAVEYLPMLHATQALSATAPMVFRYLPAPQSVQTDAPTVVEYLPASQLMHVVATVAPNV